MKAETIDVFLDEGYAKRGNQETRPLPLQEREKEDGPKNGGANRADEKGGASIRLGGEIKHSLVRTNSRRGGSGKLTKPVFQKNT